MPTRWPQALAAAALGAAALGAYAFLVEPRWLERTHTRVAIPQLPETLRGFRIALLTDLHHSGRRSRRLIERACRMAMDARPHLVALTGDFVEAGDDGFQGVMPLLGSLLDAPCGVYAVPGNHDHATGIARWREEVRRAEGVTNLTNRAVVREVGGARLRVVGVDDWNTGEPHLREALSGTDDVDVTLLLAHDPEQAEHARDALRRVDLVLSGHTHGGQVRLPLVGALRNPTRHDEIYEAGLQRRPWTQVYVSRGVGTVHLPVRFLTRPEVAILELTAA